MTDSSWGYARRRYVELTWVMAALLLVLGLATFATMGGATGVRITGGGQYQSVDVPSLWLLLSVPLTAAAPVLALGRPVVAVLAATLLPIGSLLIGLPVVLFTSFAGVLATAVVLLWRQPRLAALAALLSLVVPLNLATGAVMFVPDGSEIDTVGWGTGRTATTVALYAVAVVLVMVAGLGYRSWATNEETQSRLAAERLEVGNQGALLGERSRLARDLHDVVAHHVSLIAVRAETAPYTVPDLQPAARVVLADIADHSRQALDELRGVLGVLRRGDEESERMPQPTGADVAGLVEGARAVGPVEIEGQEHLAALGAARGYVAYRVVQEALTNARRHAPGSPVNVVAQPHEQGVQVRISNRADGVDAVRPGRGLTGMRERVEALGGTMSVGVRGGDVVVEVRLP